VSFEPLIYALIFVGVLLMVEGVYLLFFGRAQKREKTLNRRLELLEKGSDPEEVLSQLRKEREQHLGFGSIPLLSPLFEKAAQANVPFSPTAIILLTIMNCIAVFFALSYFSGAALIIRVAVSAVMGYSVMLIWLRNKAKKRIAEFEEQLPDAVELIVRSLKVGHPFSSAVNIVASEMPDPLGTEFGIIADESTYGMDVTESLERMAGRIDVPDLRFLSVAVSIQSKSGGNLAEILQGLSNVVRSRFKLFRKVKAITAEAKFSGWFLSVFPIVALLAVQLVKPDYYDTVQESPLFVPAAIFVAIMLTINVFFMRWLVDIKV
jgi:tight adherence protein B